MGSVYTGTLIFEQLGKVRGNVLVPRSELHPVADLEVAGKLTDRAAGFDQGVADFFARQGAFEVDFALVEPIVAGFATMSGAYSSKEKENDASLKRASRPFSIDRRGFVISEGAGAVIIATKEFARAHGLKHKIEIAGWSMTSDAYHFVAPHLKTVTRCISECIDNSGISLHDIDLVNAHATSTRVGDKIEYDALRAVFDRRMPPVSANKSMIGHAMGASSAIESIFAMEGMCNGIALPTINHRSDPEIDLDCVTEGARLLEQEFVLKNSFGFGGCNACIIFQRVT